MKIETPEFHNLPERISRLSDLSHNLWWSWHSEARHLLSLIDRTLWKSSQHNPIQLLRETPVERFEELAQDEYFLKCYAGVMRTFDEYVTATDTWFDRTHPGRRHELIAYFCAEFAVHTSIPIYSGGLGLLAGDTCKEASDLGLPFVAVGALYPEGYFLQRLGPDGHQESFYVRCNMDLVPLLRVKQDDGTPLLVDVPLDGRVIQVAVWRLQVGRVPIFLMDTDIPENEPWDRDLVARLYGGDHQQRLRQEIVLGVGGVRVLHALGYKPEIIHLNEGHAAFAVIENIRQEMRGGLSFDEAKAATRNKIVFTTHTPVEAGHDAFPFHMIEDHFRHYWEEFNIPQEQFLALGAPPGSGVFSMTVLALNACRQANGVSQKHGEVSRNMWHFLYPGRPVEDVPIVAVTNGVHIPTWLSREMVILFEKYLGPDWSQHLDDLELWGKIFDIPDQELWTTHASLKTRLFRFMRERARKSWKEGADPSRTVALGSLLNPEALTIGFARRFATYKRATLILSDRERLKALLHNPWRPLQIVFAGKAHPADEPGKFFLKQIYEVCASPEFAGHIAIIENYDKHVAHHLVQGVDVWLNNPEPPKEASGTSGQKASLNGVINFSVLDGWWCEGYNGKNGWAIDGSSDHASAHSIYELLEREIIPAFYRRDSEGLPIGWIQTMKEAIRSTAAPFSTRRMLKEYYQALYRPESSE